LSLSVVSPGAVASGSLRVPFSNSSLPASVASEKRKYASRTQFCFILLRAIALPLLYLLFQKHFLLVLVLFIPHESTIVP
jgi:hypothetical protein